MQKIARISLSLLILFSLLSCASYQNITLEPFNSEAFSLRDGDNTYMLYVSHNTEGYNFALFDMLGSPIANKIFKDSSFSNARFLPPNSRYDEAFYESLNMIKHSLKSKILESGIEIIKIDDE